MTDAAWVSLIAAGVGNGLMAGYLIGRWDERRLARNGGNG